MKTCRKIPAKCILWFGSLLIGMCFGNGCKTTGQNHVFSPLPVDSQEDLPRIPRGEEQRVYFVGGEVRLPGRQFYIGATTVTKAIQSAGDFTDCAAKRRVQLSRANGQNMEVNCVKAVNDPALDLAVYPGDKVEVPQRTFWDSFR